MFLLDKILKELLDNIPEDPSCYKNVENVLNFILTTVDEKEIVNSSVIYDEINLTESNIDKSLYSCSAKIYYYGYKETVCNSYMEFLDIMLDTREAKFMEEFRKKNTNTAFKEKEADIKRMLNLDWEYRFLKILYKSIQFIKSFYSPIVKAYDAQSRLLMSINKRDMFKSEGGMN